MVKTTIYILLALCVLVGLWGVLDKDGSSVQPGLIEGQALKLLSEFTDEEMVVLVLPEGAGQISDQVTVVLSPEEAEVVGRPLRAPVVQKLGCLLVGELREIDEVKAIELRLAEKGANTVRVTRILEELGPYMVYVPPRQTFEEARQTIDELKEDGVDSIIIRDGPYDKGISIGVFRSEENSAALVARIRALGYDVRRRRVTIETELYSLQVSGSALANIEESFWQQIRSSYQDLAVDEKSCDEVASARNFQ